MWPSLKHGAPAWQIRVGFDVSSTSGLRAAVAVQPPRLQVAGRLIHSRLRIDAQSNPTGS